MKRTLATLVAAGIGGAALAAPPSAGQDTPNWYAEVPTLRQTTYPWLLSAEPLPTGAFIALDGAYAELSGRRLELKEGMVGVVLRNGLMGWYSRQNLLGKGRSGGRLSLDTDHFGLRIPLQQRGDDQSLSSALQFEAALPGDLDATSGGAALTYFAPKSYTGSVIFSDGRRNHYAAAYTYAEGRGSGRGHGYFLTYRRELLRQTRFSLDAQVRGGLQTVEMNGSQTDFRAMAMLYGNYQLAKGFNLEADFTLYPAGIPLNAGRASGLSSFMVYRPGGITGEFAEKASGFASARLVASFSF